MTHQEGPFMSYTPHTQADVDNMLDTIGVDTIDQLFEEIPAKLRSFKLQVPDQQSELLPTLHSQSFAEQARPIENYIGAGAYEHYIPAAVWDLVSRGEFMTAYTPYQAEASQGTLQVIFEYQTMMTQLTGLAVSNASMYDGATALAEAVLMSVRAHKGKARRSVVIPKNLHPHYQEVVQNLTHSQDITIIEVDYNTTQGVIEASALKDVEPSTLAAVVIAQPNFFGQLESIDDLTDWTHQQGALLIGVVNPTSLALLKPPGEWGKNGADIAVGEGQPLGVPLSGGGPYFGFMCCSQKLVRQLPGRIVGQTLDLAKKVGYTLTLQAREQHIRRSKATSNICTNQGLAVTAATIYMSIMGPSGLAAVAQGSIANTQALTAKLAVLNLKPKFNQHFFHEVTIELPIPAREFISQMLHVGIDPGLDLGQYNPALKNCLLICVTETKTQAQLDRFVEAAKDILAKAT